MGAKDPPAHHRAGPRPDGTDLCTFLEGCPCAKVSAVVLFLIRCLQILVVKREETMRTVFSIWCVLSLLVMGACSSSSSKGMDATADGPSSSLRPVDMGAADFTSDVPITPGICDPGLTRICVGPGACAGGQACLASGTWSACDCGSATGGATGADGGPIDGGTASTDAKMSDALPGKDTTPAADLAPALDSARPDVGILGVVWPAVDTYNPAGNPNPVSGNHHALTVCTTCHSSGGTASNMPLLFGATIYGAVGTTAAPHVEVAITDGANTYTAYSGTNGNGWVPLPVGTFNWANARAYIRNANGLRMMTGTPTAACNSCHTGLSTGTSVLRAP